MEKIYAAFDEAGHVDEACSDNCGASCEGMQLVEFDGDWQNVHFMRLSADGETLELDEAYKAEVEAGWAEAQERAAAEAQARALKQRQVAEAASMYAQSLALPRAQAVSVCMLYPDWSGEGVQYEAGDWVRYEGDLYRVEQAHASQPDWMPDAAPSLYTRIAMCPDGIRLWVAPTHAENSFDKGETCHYPDADGPVYVSTMDGNTAEPTKPGAMWEAVA